ncbi:MAG: toxin ParE1/3/4 [Thermomicrobiales bacterium]|jgi:toxin ParE1/3/4|nr:toxin ParE1/3/4 [Thermomicrobiales bacterium]MEA2585961.1 toxin ParE1/3/4 [Thermomicrobiales bacterium]
MSARSTPAPLTPEERADYTAILLYTLEAWGEQQMDAYSAHLEEAFRTINRKPGIGKVRDELRPGLRSDQVKHHVIYYHVAASAVTVVRILRERMDAANLLRG